MRSALETTDIFRGAFFLCNGATLAEVRLDGNGHRIVSFLIEGDGIDQLDLDYRSGQALVNPLLFRETLNHLRDILFKKLRDNVDNPPSVWRNGRTRYDDRKRDNRGHQARR